MLSKCEICQQHLSVSVVSSQLGPISSACCPRCLTEGYEQLGIIVASLYGIASFDALLPGPADVIRKSIAFHGVTESQLWEKVADFTVGYEDFLVQKERDECRT